MGPFRFPRFLAALILALGLAVPGGAHAAAETPQPGDLGDEDLIATLLETTDWDEGLFTDAFLAQVPLARIRTLSEQVRDTIGTPVTVTGEGQDFVASTPTHTMPVTLVRDGTGRVAGLLFGAPEPSGRSVSDILSDIEQSAPQAAYLVTRGGETLHAHNAQGALAVGSAFKLGVLDALQRAIQNEEAAWEHVITLEARHKSLPSGQLQDFPAGSPLTLHTLASLMIAQSDNTATDALMNFVGRDNVGAALGIAAPLTTRELFVLKADADLRERYRALDPGDGAERAALFEAIAAAPLPGPGDVSTPHSQGAEWYVSLQTLCGLARDLSGLDVFTINPGLARPAQWSTIAFKGGSEIGVLNLTTALVDEAGARYCVAMTLNAPEAIDDAQATGLYSALLSQLAGEATD